MTSKVYTRKRQSRAGILAAGLLAGGLLLGGTGAGFELAAPGPVATVHAAHAAPVPWPQPGQPGGGPAPAPGANPVMGSGKSHPLLASAGRLALRHLLHVHGIYIRQPHILPWWLRRGGN